MFTEKEVRIVKHLGEILARVERAFKNFKVSTEARLRTLEGRIKALENDDESWSREFYKKRITERIEVGNKNDFLYELAKRVERLEDKME